MWDNEETSMTMIGKALRRREMNRNRRAIERAIQDAPSEATRSDLIAAAQRRGY